MLGKGACYAIRGLRAEKVLEHYLGTSRLHKFGPRLVRPLRTL